MHEVLKGTEPSPVRLYRTVIVVPFAPACAFAQPAVSFALMSTASISRFARRAADCCAVLIWLAVPSAPAGQPLDPRATILPTYQLPASATIDGNLQDWAAVPCVSAEQFKLNLARETIGGTADFGPSLRCGMKAGSTDLYFLVLVRDSELRAEDSYNGLAGDCLELYLDFGREERDRTTPDWFKVPYSNSYYPRQEPPRCLGQIVIRPPTLNGPAKVFKSPNAENWAVDVACTLVAGGVAYEVRVDAASVLADLKMPTLPALVGLDVGFIDQDLAPRLQAENWANDHGIYRLFGDWVDDAVPTGYGRLATHAVPVGTNAVSGPLPKPLLALFGKSPTANDVRKALGRATPERTAELVTWAGMQGLTFEPALVRQLMASSAPAIRESCLAVLAFTEQGTTAVTTAVAAAYAPPQTPEVLALANLLSQRLALGPTDRFRALLTNDDMTVAFTAAAALAQVGDTNDVALLDTTCEARCVALTNGPASQALRDTGYHHWYAGKAQRAPATRTFFGVAREALLARLDPIEIPAFTPVRQVKAANTDLERFIPIDGNNVYNGAGLLRRWPAQGPRELWRIAAGQGKSAVVEAGGRAYTAALEDTRQWALCLEAATGKTLWRTQLADESIGAREIVATPVIDGDRVYYVPGRAGQEEGLTVVCLKAADGTEVWRGRDELEHVAACPTPLIVGDVLYCPLCGGRGSLPVLVAADKLTGKVLWRATESGSGSRGGSGIASPTYQVIDGMGQIILSAYDAPMNEVWGVSATTGERLWRYGSNAHYAMIPSPVADGSRVFLCDGLPPFSACLQMYVRQGRIQARQTYYDKHNQCNLYNTVAVVDGCVYGFGNAALQCTRLADGKLLWQREDRDWSRDPQLIVADGLIFALGTFNLVLAQATPEEYRELGRVRHGVALGYIQQPSLANGRLYLRGDKAVVCYDVLGH